MAFRIVGPTGSETRQVMGFGDWSTVRGTFGGAFGARHCITNGDFTPYVCDSTATRPSSQITLGGLVIYIDLILLANTAQNVSGNV